MGEYGGQDEEQGGYIMRRSMRDKKIQGGVVISLVEEKEEKQNRAVCWITSSRYQSHHGSQRLTVLPTVPG